MADELVLPLRLSACCIDICRGWLVPGVCQSGHAPTPSERNQVTDLLDQLIVDTPAKRWLRMYLDHQEKEFCLIWPFTRALSGL
jgi:hypothetical protein